MRARPVVTLALGLVLAGGAVYLVDQRLRPNSGAAVAEQPAIPMGRIVLARKDLAYGVRLNKDFLVEVAWPLQSMPKGAFASVGDLLGDGSEERIVLRGLVADEPVLAGKISGFGAKATIATKLASDKRAFTIRINDVSGVAGFVLPGDRVDLMLTRSVGEDSDNLVTDTILQNVTILGIDQLTDEQREKPQPGRTATVEVSPDEAQKLALAMQIGTLSLALRNTGQTEVAKSRRIAIGDLVAAEPKAIKPAAPAAPAVRIRRGAAEPSTQTVRGG